MALTAAGLLQQPFRARGAPTVVVPYAAQKAAMRFLSHTLSHPRGLGLFHGPRLSGKTFVIRQFMASLPDDHGVAVVDGAAMEATALLREMLSQFGYDLGLDSESERFNMVKVFAMQQAAHDRAPLLIVENAHALRPISMETLCHLADLTDRGKSALRLILVSDRPMLPIVRAPAMQSISKRVTGEFLLRPLTRKETADYVYKKLISAGCRDPQRVVPPAVCDRLHATSGGWPGKIDRLTLIALSKADRRPMSIHHVPRRTRPGGASANVTKLEPPAAKSRLARAESTGDAGPHLILTCRGKTLQRVALDGPRLMIGSNELCDLRIANDSVSRQHAVVSRKGGATIVADLKSRNGTWVNGKRITRQGLINNDIITVGDHRIKFIDPAARNRAPVRGSDWDDTTIAKSITHVRDFITKRWSKLG